jgi:hypothetical protein
VFSALRNAVVNVLQVLGVRRPWSSGVIWAADLRVFDGCAILTVSTRPGAGKRLADKVIQR